MVLEILTSFFLQVLFTVGIIFLFGFIIALCNKRFYSNFGNYGRAVCYITGAIGTPLHECAHALFCVIFGHKITEIKLYQINSSDGTLGYVNHSYNPKNVYQKIGNFFIGVAPIIVISAILYLLAYLLLPEYLYSLTTGISSVDIVADFSNMLVGILSSVPEFFMYARTWQWWVFLVIGLLLALHMTLSKADIKGALSGLIALLVILVGVDIVLGLVGGGALHAFTSAVLSFSGWLLCMLVLSTAISCIALSLSYIFKSAYNRVLKRKNS